MQQPQSTPGRVPTRRTAAGRRAAIAALFGVVAAAAALAAPAGASAAASLVAPADGTHFDDLERAPMLTFDPASGERPKWILLASDAAMAHPVRYCRQFVWAVAEGGYHWGCNRWATGADANGNDRLLALEPGKVYYWQVVGKAATGDAEVTSPVRSFAIDAAKPEQSVPAISDHVNGTVFDDGTQLNLGAAAYVNSGVHVQQPTTKRLTQTRFEIIARHSGTSDTTRSYVKISSAVGTRYLHVTRISGGVRAVWNLTGAEQRLKHRRFTYQVFVKSIKNGALVRSAPRVVVIKSIARPPAWKAD